MNASETSMLRKAIGLLAVQFNNYKEFCYVVFGDRGSTSRKLRFSLISAVNLIIIKSFAMLFLGTGEVPQESKSWGA
jgi:hypothetical protein